MTGGDGYQAVYRESAGLAPYFQGLDKPARLERGKVYELMLDCWSTALVFNRGHRIGLPANAQNHDPVIHVAPAGNDAHPGTKDKPFERIGLKKKIPPQGRP